MIDRAVLLRARRPPLLLGALAMAGGLTAATLAIYPLRHAAPVESLGVVYLPVVVLVSMFWGMRLGVASAVLSALAFGFFHLPPTGRLAISDGRDWTGLAALVVAAAATGLIADLARTHAREADQRRREADLSAELARLLLGAMQLQDALPVAAQRVAEALGAEHAAILLAPHAAAGAGAGEAAIPLEADGEPLGTLLVPAGTSPHQLAWTRARLVPSLVSILAAALHRERLGAEVVETAALRRSDELKTAVLRSVSHDLRTPVTAILSAAGTLDPARAEEARVGEVRDLVTDAATRLSLLIEKLLDLSVLQAGTHEPRVGSYSLEEVVHEAIAHVGGADGFRLSIDPELPSIRGDAVQLERAFANVLENAARHSGGEPVAVRARALAATGGATQQGGRVRVLVVDRGPGIARSEWERVFLPFYRAPGADQEHHGSGLGLAIAKGFIEANGGRIAVESVPGQGTSMVIELPLGDPDSEPVGAPLAAGAAGGR